MIKVSEKPKHLRLKKQNVFFLNLHLHSQLQELQHEFLFSKRFEKQQEKPMYIFSKKNFLIRLRCFVKETIFKNQWFSKQTLILLFKFSKHFQITVSTVVYFLEPILVSDIVKTFLKLKLNLLDVFTFRT